MTRPIVALIVALALSGCTPLTKRQPSPFEQRLDRCERNIELLGLAFDSQQEVIIDLETEIVDCERRPRL